MTARRTRRLNTARVARPSRTTRSAAATPPPAARPATSPATKSGSQTPTTNVYVYNTSGGLLGSWAAGSLPVNADVQGITTNGADIWIVDAKSDKVYRYASAASRLSGSQSAASSFSLN